MTMMTVKEVSEKSGVSVRTLHYYDEIGLLHPEEITSAGYRLYGKRSLMRLQEILLLRELEFPLKDIAAILDDPKIDKAAAMEGQIKLLTTKLNRLSRLISLAERIRKGEDIMDFKAFDKSEIEKYQKEARERWGDTDAYKESQRRTGLYGKEEWQAANQGITNCFVGFGAIKELSPASDEAKAQAKALQDTITANFYQCTKEILASLGRMYIADDRFRENIDRMGGEGTAEFAAKAIEEYCK